MRTLILALVATTALGLATAASAQMMTSNEGPSGAGGGGVPQGLTNGQPTNSFGDGFAANYDRTIMNLKRKMDRVTREDGGHLTLAHQASLQAELDQVNRQFGLKPQIPRRASFGHHEPAPGGSSAS